MKMQRCLIIYRYFILAILISSLFFTELIAYSSELDSTIEKGDKYYNDFSNLSALKEYTKAYGLDPKNFEVLMKITRAYNDVGEDYKEQGSAEAEGYFIKAFEHSEIMKELFPQRGETYFFMAATRGNLALFKGGKEKVKLGRDIEKYARKAIELKPDYGEPHVALGVYYREVANLNWFLKKFAKAFFGGLPDGTNEDSLKMLLKAEQLLPQNVYVQFELGKTYKEIGNKEKMKEHFNKALRLPNTDHRDKYFKMHIKSYLEE
jgi:tetratricopeptide (TPR) repeat protein